MYALAAWQRYLKSRSCKVDSCSAENVEPMAISSWKLLQPVFRVNQQTYRYLSGIRKRETMALSRSKRARGPDRGSRRSSATGFQKNEIRLSSGKDSYTNEFIVTGKRQIRKDSEFIGLSSEGTCYLQLENYFSLSLPLLRSFSYCA